MGSFNLLIIGFLVLFVCCQAKNFTFVTNSTSVALYKSHSLRSGAKARNAINTLYGLSKKLETYIEKPINEALVELGILLKTPKDVAFRYIQSFEDLLDEKAQEFIEIIIGKEEEASKKGYDIFSCTRENIETISALPKLSVQLATRCIMDEIQKAEDSIVDAINNINASHAEAKKLWKELNDCQQADVLTQATCIVTLPAKITLALGKIPLKVTTTVQSATLTVATFRTRLAICTAGRVASLAVQAGAMVADVLWCAAQKYPRAFLQGFFRKTEDVNLCPKSLAPTMINISQFLIWNGFCLMLVQFF